MRVVATSAEAIVRDIIEDRIRKIEELNEKFRVRLEQQEQQARRQAKLQEEEALRL